MEQPADVAAVRDPKSRHLDHRRQRQDITLKWVFAVVGLVVMLAELVLATVVFWRYTSAHDWHVPEAVVATYLGATVVQAVALVTVMTRSLFTGPPEPG